MLSYLTVAWHPNTPRLQSLVYRGASILAVAVAAVLFAGASPALAAAAPAPAWAVRSVALPTNFSTEDTELCEEKDHCDSYVVTAVNVGTVASSGVIVLTDTLPAGVEVVGVAHAGEHEPGLEGKTPASCEPEGMLVTCRYEEGPVSPEGVIEFRVSVIVTTDEALTVTNRVEVKEGAAPPASSAGAGTAANTINGPPPTFGIQDFGGGVLGSSGVGETQAGAHPATVTTALDYTTDLERKYLQSDVGYPAIEEPKMEIVDLPAGLVGDPLALERCAASTIVNIHLDPEKCPADSRVGFVEIEKEGGNTEIVSLFNVTPEEGYPAQFGFEFNSTVVMLRARVLPTEAGYVVSVSAPYLPRSAGAVKVTGARVTLFGDPAERNKIGSPEAFFTNPDACASGPAEATAELDSWIEPDDWQKATTTLLEASATHGVTGCSALTFSPSIQVAPETTTTDTPSGYEVDLKVPQAPNIPGDLATPDLKDAVVNLPEGVSVSPGAAAGLVGCQERGPEGIELGSEDKLSDDNVVQEGEEEGPDGLVHPARGHCPAASQIGEVEVVTPLLANPLEGHVYVAAPQCGGVGQKACTPASAEDGELFGIYLEVEGAGVVMKLKGDVSVNPQTGRLTTRFEETPQLPFSELKLKLHGGPRAPLANPQSCGVSETTSDLTPWSTPETPDATPRSAFAVVGCAGSAFSPAFTAGTVGSAAAAYSPFTLTFSRHDGEQDLSGLTVNMPQGLLGKIAGIAKCGEAEVQAEEDNSGACPAASEVGTATAAAGAGSAPYYQSGPVYLTGPYNGAPFGLAVVVPANAGPFHLGNIVVRAAIHISLTTAAVTVVSNPLPQMIDGVPLRVQTVNVTVGGEGHFTFNPTSCAPSAVGATITSAQGATADVSSPFQATGCANLPFKPVLTASTSGKASKAHGASLDTKIVFPAARAGTGQASADANIASVKVGLPKQLPSRNTTLQKACLAATFDADPASCPAASDVGSVLVHTPVLSVPLAGPAYLVSYGGEKFPQLVVILQGEGVTIDVVGSIFVSKKGITSVTFKTVPDAPFTSFELKTPEGPYSVLTAFVPAKKEFNLCGQTLTMPTEIAAQNGAVIRQSTKIGITGCPKAKKVAKKKAKSKKAKKATNAARPVTSG
jgi:hypothetical protein